MQPWTAPPWTERGTRHWDMHAGTKDNDAHHTSTARVDKSKGHQTQEPRATPLLALYKLQGTKHTKAVVTRPPTWPSFHTRRLFFSPEHRLHPSNKHGTFSAREGGGCGCWPGCATELLQLENVPHNREVGVRLPKVLHSVHRAHVVQGVCPAHVELLVPLTQLPQGPPRTTSRQTNSKYQKESNGWLPPVPTSAAMTCASARQHHASLVAGEPVQEARYRGGHLSDLTQFSKHNNNLTQKSPVLQPPSSTPPTPRPLHAIRPEW